jgi:SAM-dependent methyltransferase
MRLLLRRLVHRLDNFGWLRLFRRTPSFPDQRDPHPFDQRHGVDTSGYTPGERLPGFFNTAYYAISPSTLERALHMLPEPVDAFTFVDLGCGKGRALLVAAGYPFIRILGVEIDPGLAQIARRNAAPDPRIRVETGDAKAVAYSDTPLIVFLYHPFLAPLLSDVLKGLAGQRIASPHATYLLYANGTYDRQVKRLFEQVWDFRIELSTEDRAADRHGIRDERYTLWRLRRQG